MKKLKCITIDWQKMITKNKIYNVINEDECYYYIMNDNKEYDYFLK